MATQPKITDRVVRVTAYLTDEVFGYEHWRAAQFSAPDLSSRRPAVLVLFESEAARDLFLEEMKQRFVQR